MNMHQATVQKRPGATGARRPKGDRRVLRTRHALGAAIIELMLERDFATITVQDVLDRAEVSRATFYAHYRSKRDLFLSEHERFFEGIEHWLGNEVRHGLRVAPVAELFQHMGEMSLLMRALRASGLIDLVWEDATEHFTRMIAKRLPLLAPRLDAATVQMTLIARFCAGALLELLKWWLSRDVRPTPMEMDVQYHCLVRQAVTGMSRG